MPSIGRMRNACATIYNMSRERFEEIAKGICSFWVYGLETCPATKRLHLQVYMEFTRQVPFLTLKEAFGCHLEPRKGSPREAAGYCKKGTCDKDKKPALGWAVFYPTPDPTWVGNQEGEISKGNASEQLQGLQQLLQEGATPNQIVKEQPWAGHQFGRILLWLDDIERMEKRRTEMTKGIWLYGPSGCGKSKFVTENHPHKDIYWVPDDKGWWDNYKGQPVVLFDDFRGDFPFASMLRLVDRYHYDVPRRGRAPIPFTSPIVYVTCPLPPEGIYTELVQGDNINQLHRRFEIREMLAPQA